MIHPFCAPSEQLQEASCFSNQASPRLLMTMISEAVDCPGTRSVLAAGWEGAGQLHLPVTGERPRPMATGLGWSVRWSCSFPLCLQPLSPVPPAPLSALSPQDFPPCKSGFLGQQDTQGHLSPKVHQISSPQEGMLQVGRGC